MFCASAVQPRRQACMQGNILLAMRYMASLLANKFKDLVKRKCCSARKGEARDTPVLASGGSPFYLASSMPLNGSTWPYFSLRIPLECTLFTYNYYKNAVPLRVRCGRGQTATQHKWFTSGKVTLSDNGAPAFETLMQIITHARLRYNLLRLIRI